MELDTHLEIDKELCGTVVALSEGAATVELALSPRMGADAQGLVHGGFLFGAADYAAMAAVNDPFVVLGSAETRFLRPSRIGGRLVFEARVTESVGKKRKVEVTGRDEAGQEVFAGTFACFVLAAHVLAPKG